MPPPTQNPYSNGERQTTYHSKYDKLNNMLIYLFTMLMSKMNTNTMVKGGGKRENGVAILGGLSGEKGIFSLRWLPEKGMLTK
jgi:hypothetical protein